MNRTDKLRQVLSFDKKGLVCLAPNKDSINKDSMLLSSHERTLCDCEVLEIMAKAEKLHKVLCDALDRIESAYSMRQADIWLDKNMSPLEYIESEISEALAAIDAVLEGVG